jgi:GNAT superfamily N-acetyltransferase
MSQIIKLFFRMFFFNLLVELIFGIDNYRPHFGGKTLTRKTTMQFNIEETLITEALLKKFDRGFSEHALESIGHPGEVKRRAFVVHTDGLFVGAMTVGILWGTLQIRQLFIESPYRRQGIGTQFINHAFIIGKEEHCRVSFVETMSFQALPFYQKFGFTLEFARHGFDRDAVLYYLRKEL